MLLLTEKKRRTDLERWRTDPAAYFEERLHMVLWSDFKTALSHVRPGKRLLILGANGVGKTEFLAGVVLWHHECFEGKELLTSSSWTTLTKSLWPRIHKYIQQYGMFVDESVTMVEIKSNSNPEHQVFSKSPQQPESIQGYHSEHLLQVIEEGSAIEARIADAIDGNDTGANGIQVWSANPLRPEGPVYDRAVEGLFELVSINAMHHPNVVEGKEIIPGAVTRKSIEDKAFAWCKRCDPNAPDAVHLFWLGDNGWFQPDPRFTARVLGKYPKDSEYALLSRSLLESAANRERVIGLKKGTGCDVARFGSDDTVIAKATDNGIYEITKMHGRRTTETAGNLIAIYREEKQSIAVDDDGVGGGVSDNLHESGTPYLGVNFNATSEKPEAYVNLKAQIYWEWKEEVENNPHYFIPDNKDLIREATSIRWRLNHKGQIVIESKEEYKGRVGRSPDTLEAVLLAHYAVQRKVSPGVVANTDTRAYEEYMRREQQRQQRGRAYR